MVATLLRASQSVQASARVSVCSSVHRTRSVDRRSLPRRARAGLHTGPISSFMKACASMPSGHGPAPMRIATSTPSRAKSTGADDADSRTSIAGCRALKSYSRGISQRIMKVGKQDTINGPCCATADRRAALASTTSSAVRAAGRKAAPASVSSTRRLTRRNRRTPRCVSSDFICRLMAPCVRLSSRAAALKLRCRAASSKAGSAFKGGNRRLAMACDFSSQTR